MLLREPFGWDIRIHMYPVAAGGHACRQLIVDPLEVQASACLQLIGRLDTSFVATIDTHTEIMCNPALAGAKMMDAAIPANRGYGEVT